MGSTFLQLTNRALVKLNEVKLTDSSFTTARGIHEAAELYVQDAVRTICTQEFEWPFLQSSDEELLVVGQNTYTFTASDIRRPDWDSMYIEKDDTLGNSHVELKLIDRDDWISSGARASDYNAGSDGRNVPHVVWKELANNQFGISESPNQAYTVKYDYFKIFDNLMLFDDECVIPSEYDPVILAKVMQYMYLFLDNDTRAALFEADYNKLFNEMRRTLVPTAEKMRGTEANFGGGSQYGRLAGAGYIKTWE